MAADERKRNQRAAGPVILLLVLALMTPATIIGVSFFRPIELRVPGHTLLFGRVPQQLKAEYEMITTPNVFWAYNISSNGVESEDSYLIALW